MSRIVFVSQDVLFWSRVSSLATAAGTEAVRIGDEAGMEKAFGEGGVARVIVDLSVRGVDLPGWARRWASADPRPELIAFGSHVDEAALSAARDAGFDRVMPNSRFHRELAELVR
jgi:DNA-binding response OmpR family regulator